MDEVETIEYRNHEIVVFVDEWDNNPRTAFDNLGKMIYWHSKYILGDEQPNCSPEEWFRRLAIEVDPTAEYRMDYWENGNGWIALDNKYEGMDAVRACEERVQAIIDKAIDDHVIMLSLYIYDHSGIAMRTYPFSCPWDSGQVGYIYVTKEQVRKEYSKRVTRQLRKRIEEYLKGEVETFAQYVSGNVYGYQIRDKDGDLEGGCWGFYGYDHEKSGLLEHARPDVDYMVDQAIKQGIQECIDNRQRALENYFHEIEITWDVVLGIQI